MKLREYHHQLKKQILIVTAFQKVVIAKRR